MTPPTSSSASHTSSQPSSGPSSDRDPPRKKVVRVQTGVRLEKRMVKVLKALAEYLDLSMGDLLEGIVLHAFAGQAPFSDETLGKIRQLEDIYGLDLGVDDAHRLEE